MNDLTNKSVIVSTETLYVYSQLMYNGEYYILTKNEQADIQDAIHIYKLVQSEEKLYVNDNIDEKVIEKFIVFLSL